MLEVTIYNNAVGGHFHHKEGYRGSIAGQRLIEFCQENALVIANTLFQQHKRRLYTWTSPVNTEIRLIIFSAAKMEKLYTVNKNKSRS